jgi:PDZ domain
MSAATPAPYRNLVLALAGILLVVGILAAMDLKNQTYTGFQTDGNNKVVMVEAGSNAAAGGLQVGDVLSSVNGIAVTDTKALLQRPRPAVGDQWTYVVDRGGQSVNLQITQGPLPPKYAYTSRAATLLGLCYLGFTLWAYLTAPGAATLVLAFFGLSFGLAFLGVPYIESPALRNLVGSIITMIILLGIAALLHFLLAFPTPRPFLQRKSATGWLYGPAILLSLCVIGFSVLQPDSTSGVNIFFRTAFSLLIGIYFLLAIVVLVRRYGAASPSDRAAFGLGLMVAGVVVGLGPLLIVQVVTLLSPGTFLPGAQFYFLTLGVIPIAFAMAAVRGPRQAT